MNAGVAPAGDLDVLVVGSGVAGLSAAVRLAAPLTTSFGSFGDGHSSGGLRVGVLTKAELSQSTTRWAQGGVAAVLGGDEDSTDLHLADTLAAGAGLCDPSAIRVLVDEGPARVEELIALGAVFDRLPGGALALAREGGHSTARVVHAGGAATGAEVERALVDATRASAAAVLEQWFAIDLLIEGGRCHGVSALDAAGRRVDVRATHTVLATGGAGQLFAVTTNPAEATGDGIAMALRAGVPVADIEFMQFHPTALHHPAMPRPLLSEALRGHGALLRDARGERFVDELAPRDVVSRAMADRMQVQGVDSLWLDATGLDAFEERFPTIAASLHAIGLDPARDWLPIAPAAHYLSGGVVTDLSGSSALPGLWAAGEVACTGVHGANRLASNSLLEGMVFGARLAESILAGGAPPAATGALAAIVDGGLEEADGVRAGGGAVDTTGAASALDAPMRDLLPGVHDGSDPGKRRDRLQRAMTDGAGVVRSASSLATAGEVLDALAAVAEDRVDSRAAGEMANLCTLASGLLRSAALRTESRGAHVRSDHPERSDRWRCRIVHCDGALKLARLHQSAGAQPTGRTGQWEVG